MVDVKGLWTVEFRSDTGSMGFGTVILDGGRIMGGDAGYYYLGKYEIAGNVIKGEVRVQKYNPGHVSIFGPLTTFNIKLSGGTAAPEMRLTGNVQEHPEMSLSLICTKRENL